MTRATVTLRPLTPEERQALEQLASSRTAQARLVERARILNAIADGRRPSQAARDLGVCRPTVYTWIRQAGQPGQSATSAQVDREPGERRGIEGGIGRLPR